MFFILGLLVWPERLWSRLVPALLIAFALMRRVLKPGGRLVLGDILRPEVGAATDVMALLKLAVKNGFLTDALWGLARTALSDYWQLRQSIGLQRYGEADMLAKLKAAGFDASLAKKNVGYNPARMTFLATPQS